jgi:hypothetical protein
MTTLADILLAPKRRDALITKTASWIERYVHELHGLRGMALRAGLATAKSARHDIVERATARLLPEFAAALEPFWQRFRATGEKDFGDYLRRHAKQASAEMMSVTDVRIAASPNRALHAAYKRLRGTLEHELEKLLPDIARMIGGAIRK